MIGACDISCATAYLILVFFISYFLITIGVWYAVKVNVIIPISVLIIAILIFYNLLRASFTDPGVILRGNLEESDVKE